MLVEYGACTVDICEVGGENDRVSLNAWVIGYEAR